MLFAFMLSDSPGSAALRPAHIEAHKAYLAAAADRIAFAGPLLAEDGGPAGSLLVIAFDSRAAAEAWLAAEPFTRAGVYAESRIAGFVNRWPQKTGFPES